MTYDGTVFQGLQLSDMSNDELTAANQHLRIISALYGYLQPSDCIRPYRLEMNAKLQFKSFSNLYEYWKPKLSQAINQEAQSSPLTLVNLCSNEYWKAIDTSSLPPNIQIMECVFKDNGRIIAVHAKRARGLMARHLLQQLSSRHDPTAIVQHIKAFQSEGYKYDEKASSSSQLVFHRMGRVTAPVEETKESNGPLKKKPRAK